MKAYKRLLDAIGTVELVFGVFLIGLIIVTITVQVVTRYALNQPIAWVEELATYSFIWGTFIGAKEKESMQRSVVGQFKNLQGKTPSRWREGAGGGWEHQENTSRNNSHPHPNPPPPAGE